MAEAQADKGGAPRCTLTLRKVGGQSVEPPPVCTFSVKDETVEVAWEQTATEPRPENVRPAKLPQTREWVAEQIQVFLVALSGRSREPGEGSGEVEPGTAAASV